MNYAEVAVFVIYLLFMLGIGVYFFVKSKSAGGEKAYFLGGRKMGPFVTALSAGASDMSAWVLMGLPTSVYAAGLGKMWIAIGLLIGYTLSWIFEAKRLRNFSICANDSITVPQYLTNRFRSSSKLLQIMCAVVFLIAYTIYAASSIKACGTLFNKVIGLDTTLAMVIAAVVIVSYTFLGGFSAVCWTDFFQGLLILGAMLIAPIFAVSLVDFGEASKLSADYWNPMASWQDIVSGLGWGLGYFGMPHIIVRFMSLRSSKEIKKSGTVAVLWTTFILAFAAIIGIVGRLYLGESEEVVEGSLVFVNMVRNIFPALIAGLLLSAVLAASMSTADSQLLAASSAFAADVYKPVIRKEKATDKEMIWAGRVVVLIIAVVAMIIALNPGAGSIMSMVENAWGLFGAAFGPVIILSLYWRRMTFAGASAGIFVGAIVDVLWYALLSSKTGVYEIIPGFAAGLIATVVISLVSPAPGKEVEKLFDDALELKD
jgi:sodium/proline symporter